MSSCVLATRHRTPSRRRTFALAAMLVAGLIAHTGAQATLGPAHVSRAPNPAQQTNALFGHAVAALNDVNGDNVPDFAVGAPGVDRVYVLSGAERKDGRGHDLIRVIADPHPWLTHAFGFAIADVGDVNGDGVDDLAVGAPDLAGSQTTPCIVDPLVPGSECLESSQAYVMSGATGALVTRLKPGDSPAMFGYRVAALGDITGDGVPDVVVSDPALSSASSGFVSAASGASGDVIWTTRSGEAGVVGLGLSLATTADVDGDGEREAIASVIDDRGTARRALIGWVLSSADGHVIRTHFISEPGAELPPTAGLAEVGDQDGDRVGDYITANVKTRHIVIWSGVDGHAISAFDGPFFGATDDAFGWSIAAVGDKDGDNISEFWIAAPGEGNIYLVNKYGQVLAAAADPTPPTATGANAPGFGHQLSAIANIGGDAGADVVVGEPGESSGAARGAGAAHIVTLPAKKT